MGQAGDGNDMLFDIAPSEFLVIAGAAIIFIGPKDMPRALRTAGKWFAQMRRVSNHFRAGVENLIREAEMAEMEKEWRERNAAIMQAHPSAAATPSGELMAGEAYAPPLALADHAEMNGAKGPVSEGMVPQWPTPEAPVPGALETGEPELPLTTPRQPPAQTPLP